jgi:hypothetical protein
MNGENCVGRITQREDQGVLAVFCPLLSAVAHGQKNLQIESSLNVRSFSQRMNPGSVKRPLGLH